MKGKSSVKMTKKRNETKEGRKSQSKEKKPYEGKGKRSRRSTSKHGREERMNIISRTQDK